MRITLIAVGRNRQGSLYDLWQDYAKRLSWSLTLIEIDPRKHKTQIQQNAEILKALPQNAQLIALDERGRSIGSQDFSDKINTWQHSSDHLCFIIGGADGLDDNIRKKMHFLMSFGKQTWPHMLVRVMLIEQVYRAQQILAGHPYHRQ